MPVFSLRTIARRREYFAPGTLVRLGAYLTTSRRRTGRFAADLEKKLAAALELPNPALVSSGRAGLRLLLETSGLESGAEIIIPGYTFGLLVPAIRASGFTPVPVDVHRHTFQMHPEQAAAAVTPRTGAILATHLFGEPCDMPRLMEISEKNNLLLIEDCAQAMGARHGPTGVGTTGHAGFSSFDISKPLQGLRGGVVFSGDNAWIERVKKRFVSSLPNRSIPAGAMFSGFAKHFLVRSPLWRIFMMLFSSEFMQQMIVALYRMRESSEKTDAFAPGITDPSMPEILAYIAGLNMESLEERLQRRRALRSQYLELLHDTLEFQETSDSDQGSVHMVAALSPMDPFVLRRRLVVRGVDIGLGSEVADDCLAREGSHVEDISGRMIALPMHDFLQDRHVEFVASAVKHAVGTSSRQTKQNAE